MVGKRRSARLSSVSSKTRTPVTLSSEDEGNTYKPNDDDTFVRDSINVMKEEDKVQDELNDDLEVEDNDEFEYDPTFENMSEDDDTNDNEDDALSDQSELEESLQSKKRRTNLSKGKGKEDTREFVFEVNNTSIDKGNSKKYVSKDEKSNGKMRNSDVIYLSDDGEDVDYSGYAFNSDDEEVQLIKATNNSKNDNNKDNFENEDNESVVIESDDDVKYKTQLEESEKRKAESKRLQQLKRQRDEPEMKARRKLKKELGRNLTHGELNQVALSTWHPELKDVWGDLKRDVIPVQPKKLPSPDGLKLKLLPFQQESLHWMKEQEKGNWKGGMLADEMGMGKTIQMIALLLSDRVKPNLIVAPTIAVVQWKNEIEAYAEGVKVLIWHGNTRITDVKELKKYDVILTSYSVMESSFRFQHYGRIRKGKKVKQNSPIHNIKWHRIVLDEAHSIKERQTNTSKASFALESNYKWCLSGTPLQNRVGELYSLIRFIGADPFAYYFCKKSKCKSLTWSFSDRRHCDFCGESPMNHVCFWNNEILTPIQKYGMSGEGETAFKKLKILLDRMMLRRTKLERADDLGLPPRIVKCRNDFFSDEEKDLYTSLYTDARRTFSTYVDQGTILNNYSSIFSLITRMRQMACHPDLVLKSRTGPNSQNISDQDAYVCRICHDIAEDAIEARCHHVFCRLCISEYLTGSLVAQPECPSCYLPLSIDITQQSIEIEEKEGIRPAKSHGIVGRLNMDTWKSSTKIEALVEELSNTQREDSTIKSLVFSQFVNFLDLVAWRLRRAGFNICRLEGNMTPQARNAVVQHFMKNVHCTVFLVSLKAGGVALNLTEASRVYMLDSWWNPAVEYQAMDRVHRLGSRRPIECIKLVIEDSIESKIVQLQEKKSAMVEAAIGRDENAMGRLSPEDMGFLFKM